MSRWSYGARSMRVIGECDWRLQHVANRALALDVLDIAAIEGHRDEEAQERAWRQKLSHKRWPESLHNRDPSHAIHLVPWPLDWRDTERFYLLGGVVLAAARLEGVAIRFGGDWDGDGQVRDQTFMDLAHYELA